MSKLLTKGVVIGAGALFAVLARKTAANVWSKTVGAEPPSDPTDRSVGWAQAVGWMALAGAFAGIARLLAERGASEAVERATGRRPRIRT